MVCVNVLRKKLLLFPFLLVAIFMVYLYKSCGDYINGNDGTLLLQTKNQIILLQSQVSKLEKEYKYKSDSMDISRLPIIYFLTPTYERYTQQADLIRLSNTLKHIPNLHWILVEDSNSSSTLVSNLLKFSKLTYTHLHKHTQKKLVLEKNDARWMKHRGVDQRNHGLSWIRKNVKPENDGVLYFADDDNTYHLDLFAEMRHTKKVSMWPVALVGGLRFEGPVCLNGKVLKFFTAWLPSREFPVDMAAFAVNLKLIFQHPSSYINPEVQRGLLETDFLQQLEISLDDIEAKANDCTKILVWHTQTSKPNMKEEIKLKQRGLLGSNPNIII